MTKNIFIFDLDETVINSRHRTPNKPDGTLDLEGYFRNKTREKIFQDTLLPLAKFMKKVKREGHIVIVCTARDMNIHDFSFMVANELEYDYIYHRNKHRDRSNVPLEEQFSSQELFKRIKDGRKKVYPRYLQGDAQLKKLSLQWIFNLKPFKNMPKYFFDDAEPVISLFRKMEGITMLNAIKINKRLSKQTK